MGVVKDPVHSVVVWVCQNIYVRVEGSFASGDLDSRYAIPLDNLIKKSVSSASSAMPIIEPISESIQPGGDIIVKTNVGIRPPCIVKCADFS